MPTTEFVFFDLGKVICMFDHSLASKQMAELAGVEESVVHDIVFDSDLQIRYETGEISSNEFYEAFCSATNTRPDMDALLHAGSDIFSLNYQIIPIISQLRAVNFPIGILSNTCHAHWEFVCKKFPTIRKIFTSRILSYEVKSMKPDDGIYDAAIAMAGVKPEQIFFIDDKVENIQGAHGKGLDAELFTGVKNFREQLSERGIRINL